MRTSLDAISAHRAATWLLSIGTVLLLSACGARDGGIDGSGGSGAGDSCDCIDGYGSDAMDDAALQKLQSEGLPACFSSDPVELDGQIACLPHVVGKDASGRDIQVYYFCSDVCPDYGYVGISYAGVDDQGTCCSIGGAPIIDPAWGGYVGCAPPVLGSGNPSACFD